VSTRSHSLVKRFDGIYTGPYFDSNTPTNITAQLGTHAYLPCKVRQLGNKSVSYLISYNPMQNNKNNSSSVSVVRKAITLEIFENGILMMPKIEILGDRDMYVKTGSTVAIRCVIKQSLEGPFYVFWYHEGDRVLNYQLGKIDIQTKRIEQDTVSSLVIHNARGEDSGNYTCSPSNLDSASVQLHVLNGEHPAAIQRGISSAPGGCPTLWWLAGVVTLYSSHGSRLFVLVLLILMVLYSKNPSYIATER
ncbi:hypothetical protein ALC57_09373, partial [Trachymyrmex cornetzi]